MSIIADLECTKTKEAGSSQARTLGGQGLQRLCKGPVGVRHTAHPTGAVQHHHHVGVVQVSSGHSYSVANPSGKHSVGAVPVHQRLVRVGDASQRRRTTCTSKQVCKQGVQAGVTQTCRCGQLEQVGVGPGRSPQHGCVGRQGRASGKRQAGRQAETGTLVPMPPPPNRNTACAHPIAHSERALPA
jgi:hypothetical protein